MARTHRTATRTARKAKRVARRDVAAHAATPTTGRLRVTATTGRTTLLLRKISASSRRFATTAGATGASAVAATFTASALPQISLNTAGATAFGLALCWMLGAWIGVDAFDKKIDGRYGWTPTGFTPDEQIARAWVALFTQRDLLADQPAAAGWLDDVTYAAAQLLTAARQYKSVSQRQQDFQAALDKHHDAQGTRVRLHRSDIPAHLATRHAILSTDRAAALEAREAAVQLAHATVSAGQGLWEHLSATNSLISADADTARSRFSVDTDELTHRLEVQRAIAAQYLTATAALRGEPATRHTVSTAGATAPLSMPTGMGRYPLTGADPYTG